MKVNPKVEPLTGVTTSIVGEDRRALQETNASTKPGARVPTLTGATSAFVTEMKSSDQQNVQSMVSAAGRARTLGQGPGGSALDLSA